MSDPSFFHVVVVGAGPAGSAAALALSRAGLRVALLEKARLPRYKTCGGGLLARTLKLLPAEVSSTLERECFSVELHHHEPHLTYSTRRDVPIVSMVMRDHFDHQLTLAAERSGARIFAGTTVREVAVAAEGVTVQTTAGTFTAAFVIGADGVGSLVARKCGYPELRQVLPAVECEVTVEEARFERFRSAARFDLGLTPRGYGWVFPKQKHLSVGVLTTRRGGCNLNDEYRRYLTALGLTEPLEEERHGYMIPTCPRAGLFRLPRVFLVGDAAGLVDPVTAEGISAALLSGQLAADAVIQNQTNPQEAMGAYRAALRTALFPDLRIARFLARALYDCPRLRGWIFARHGQALSEFVTDVVMGTARYRDAVLRPRSYLRLLRFAIPN